MGVENPLFDDRFRKSIIKTMPYDGPLDSTQEAVMSVLMNEYILNGGLQIKQKKSTNKKDTIEYCIRCNSRKKGRRCSNRFCSDSF